MTHNKPGRPRNTEARRIVLACIKSRAGVGFHELWREIRGSGISKGLYVQILRELAENGSILRIEGTREVKTVIFQCNTKNDLSTKQRTGRVETYSSCENVNGADNPG